MVFNRKSKKQVDSRDNVIIINEKGYEIITEAFNRLKDNILYLNADNQMKVIQISSSIANEGKTTVITNLAASLALNNKKVIIVDCDFRKPKVHRAFNLDNSIGIYDYMQDKKQVDDIITKTNFGVFTICRGDKIENPSAVLTSSKFKKLIEDLKEKYDYVFLDCPPVLEISDYIHISSMANGLIYCVAYGKTKKTQVKEAIGLLKQSKINMLGIVYTMVDEKNHGGYYSYKYYNSEESDN